MNDKTAIYLHGFDARSSLAINNYFTNHCENQYIVAAIEKSASIFIVDIDSELGELFVQNKRTEYPAQPIIVISSSVFSNSDPLLFVLKKPLVYEQMDSLLRQMVLITPKNAPKEPKLNNVLINHFQSRMLVRDLTNKKNKSTKSVNTNQSISTENTKIDKNKLATFIGRQADIDISNPQEVMKVVYDPSKTILNSIKKAMDRSLYEKKILELSNLNKKFIIDPSSKTIFTFVNESVLRPICLLELREKSHVKKIKKGRNDKRFKSLVENSDLEVTERNWDEFLWKMALWTSRGKLPRHIDINKPVYLSEWPNLTRLQMFPHALDIAAVMSQQTMTLSNIVAQLGIEQRYVFAFFSAAYTLGIAGTTSRQSDQLFEKKAKSLEVDLETSIKKIIKVLDQKTETSGRVNKIKLKGNA